MMRQEPRVSWQILCAHTIIIEMALQDLNSDEYNLSVPYRLLRTLKPFVIKEQRLPITNKGINL